MTYAALADLKRYLDVGVEDDDDILMSLLEAATSLIEQYTGRTFESRTETRYYGSEDLVDVRTLLLDDDLLAITSIADAEGEVASNEYVLLPRSGEPKYAIRRVNSVWSVTEETPISVEGTWGYSQTPPPSIRHACARLAAYYYRQKDAQVFDVTAIPDAGVITIPQGIPADVKAILDKYRALTGW